MYYSGIKTISNIIDIFKQWKNIYIYIGEDNSGELTTHNVNKEELEIEIWELMGFSSTQHGRRTKKGCGVPMALYVYCLWINSHSNGFPLIYISNLPCM